MRLECSSSGGVSGGVVGRWAVKRLARGSKIGRDIEGFGPLVNRRWGRLRLLGGASGRLKYTVLGRKLVVKSRRQYCFFVFPPLLTLLSREGASR